MEKKLDEKFDPVITKLDGIMKGVETLQQENTSVPATPQARRPTAETRGADSPSSRPQRHSLFFAYARHEVRQVQKGDQEMER